MLMRRIARPVARGRIDLDRHDAVAVEAGRQDAVDLPRSVAAAAQLDLAHRGPHQLRRVILIGRHPAGGEFQRIADRRDLELLAPRDVEGVGHAAEDIGAPSHILELAVCGDDIADAAQDDGGVFVLARLDAEAFAAAQAHRRHVEVVPTGLPSADLGENARSAAVFRFHQHRL